MAKAGTIKFWVVLYKNILTLNVYAYTSKNVGIIEIWSAEFSMNVSRFQISRTILILIMQIYPCMLKVSREKTETFNNLQMHYATSSDSKLKKNYLKNTFVYFSLEINFTYVYIRFIFLISRSNYTG